MNLIKKFKRWISPEKQIVKSNVYGESSTLPQQYMYVEGKGKNHFMYTGHGRPLKITAEELFLIIDLHKQNWKPNDIFDTHEWYHNITRFTITHVLQKWQEGCFDNAINNFIDKDVKFAGKNKKEYLMRFF